MPRKKRRLFLVRNNIGDGEYSIWGGTVAPTPDDDGDYMAYNHYDENVNEIISLCPKDFYRITNRNFPALKPGQCIELESINFVAKDGTIFPKATRL